MNEFQFEKHKLRAEALARRDALPADHREMTARAMFRAAERIELACTEVVSGFWPIRTEPDVRPLMQALRARGARLCLPVVTSRTTIIFREFRDDEALVPTGFGTMGPAASAAILDPRLLLVPLAAFDSKGNRLGYGAGFYDRAIARLRRSGMNPRLLGVAFDCQQVPRIEPEPHDIALDAILTESGLHSFARNG